MDDDSLAWRTSNRPPDSWRSDAAMAEEGWSIVTPAPSTPRELLAMLPGMCWEPEGDTMPDQNGYMTVREGGRISVHSDDNPWGLPARGVAYRRLLLDPPAFVPPAWHNARIVEARVLGGDRCQWASTIDGMWVSLDGSDFTAHRDYLRDVRVIVPEEVEA